MLKKYTQTDRHGNMMSQEMDGKFLKKKILKDRHGNKMSFEFDIPESNVPPVSRIPQYSAKGGDTTSHPGDPKGTDTVPAWLTPGEFVVNKEATDIFGDVIEKMNNVGRKIQKQNGSAPDKMTDVPYAAEGMFIPREFMPPHLKDRPSSVKGLESDPMFQEQLAKMLNSSLTSAGDKFSKEELYKVISGESDFKVGAKNERGSASGLFQFTTTATDDLVGRGLVPSELLNEDNNLTPEDVRRMTPTQQLKLYEAYLKGAGYKGDVPLGAMQGSPGLYSTLRKAKNPNHIIFNKDNPEHEDIFERNKGWIGKDGNITLASIQNHYDKRGSRVNKELAASKIPGTVIEAADQVPPSNVMPVASNVPVSNTSGAQSIAGVPRIDLPSDTALNAKSVPMDNFSAGVPNYAANVPMSSSVPRIGSLEPIAGPSSGRIAEVMGNLQPSPDVTVTPGNNQNVTLDISQIPQPPVASMQDADRMMGFNAGPKVPGIPAAPPYIPSITQDMLDERAMKQSAEQAVGNAVYNKLPNPAIVPTEQDIMNFSGDIAKYTPEVNEPGRSFKEVVNESFPGYNERLEKESVYPDKILSKALEQGKDINAPMFFPPTRDEKNPQGISTLPKTETETFRGTINEGKLEPPTVGGTKEVSIDEKKGKLAEVASNTKANEKLENTNKNTVEETGGKASQEEKNKATNFLEGIFGSLFNKNELKRMAVMYLGSRLMGYDHGGSLNFAVKNYVARVDSLEASRIKFSQSAQAKNYDPGSVAEYVKTGDYSKLIPLGKQIYRQGKFRNWYNKITGEKMVVEEVHEGTGDTKEVKFLGTDGKFHNKAEYDETGIYSKNNKDRLEIVNKFSKTFGDYIKELQVELGEEYGDQLNMVDGLTPGIAASEVINWMLDNRADITQIQTIIPRAYKAAIQNELSKPGNERKKVNSLVPQLGELLYKQYTGQDQLFRTQPDKKHEKDWDGVAGKRDHIDMIKFTKVLDEAAYITMSEFPEINDKNEAAALYIEDLAELWSGVRMEGSKLDDENLSKADRKDYWNYAYKTGTSGFYEFLKEKINAEMKEALKKRNESN